MGGVRAGAAAGVCVALVATLVLLAPGVASGEPAPDRLRRGDVDIDGDGRADLLIGAYGPGAIQVLYGDGGRQRISAGSVRPQRGFGLFGFNIVACDVNGDGFWDAVVGASQSSVGAAQVAGRVFVFYGATSGLSPRRVRVFSQSSPGVPGMSEEDDGFGGSLECGRIDADRFDDVVVGVVGESSPAVPGGSWHGRVVVVPGGAEGVVLAHSWAFDQASRGIPDQFEDNDSFGQNMLVADVTGDGRNELLVTSNEGGDGAVFVLPGTRDGVRTRGTTVIYGATDGRPHLWGPLVAGNFDRRGPRDVVVASSTGGRSRNAVTMLRGTPSGLTSSRSVTITWTAPGMPPRTAGMGEFGQPLDAGDVDGDRDDDLLVSSLSEKVRGVHGAGRVFVIRGGLGGITTEGVQQFTQATPGVPGRAHARGGFGRGVALLDRDGDTRTEGAISSWESLDDEDSLPSGAVAILRATPSGLTGEGARRFDPSDFGVTTREEAAGFGYDLAG